MNRMFYIGNAFPPVLAPEALLVARTIPRLVDLDWDITVLTVDQTSIRCNCDPYLTQLIPDSVKVNRIPSLEKCLLKSPLLRSLLVRILLLVGMPDALFLWYFAAVRKGKQLLREQQFDIIYSRASSFTSNIVALAMKRATNLPWVAHFSDPWVDNPYYPGNRLRRWINTKLEKAIIGEADAVVFVTRQTVDLVMRKYPIEWRNKTHVIPHGFDKDVFSKEDHLDTSGRNSKMRLVYTGSFIRGKRTPETLFLALNQLRQKLPLQDLIEVLIVGSIIDIYSAMVRNLNLGEIITFTGPKSYLESLKISAQADVLLVIDAKSEAESVFLPSKLVDYMMIEKPILGLTPRDGASADLLNRLGCPVVDPDDIAAIAQALEDLILKWQSYKLSVSEKYRMVAMEYENSHTSLQLHRILESVMQNSQKRSSV